MILRRPLAAGGLGLALAWLEPAAAAPVVEEDRPSRERDEGPDPKENHFYLNAGAGVGIVNLSTFRASDEDGRFTAGLFSTRGSGLSADVGIGARLVIATLGVRGTVIDVDVPARDTDDGKLRLWSLNGELGLHIPVGRIEPRLTVSAGYSTLGGVGDLAGIRRGVDVNGANARIGFGLDYYFSRYLSIGARASAEILFLSRESVPLRDLAEMQEVGTISEAKARVLQSDGTTAGTAYMFLFGPGLHF